MFSYSRARNLMSKIGPAWLVMIADVDVASIITGLETGSIYGYHVIFILLVLAIPLAVIQYAAGNLGAVTGKGIGEIVRERYSRRLSAISAIPMAATDFISYVAEYAGIAIGFSIIGIPPIISLPIIFIVHNAIVFSKKYSGMEKMLLPITLVLIAAIISSVFLFRPPAEMIIMGLSPIQPYGNSGFDYYIVANIGAVIMPFMLYYQAGATAEKRLGPGDLRLIKRETYVGALVSELLMVGVVIAGTFMGGKVAVRYLVSAARVFGPASPYLISIGFISSGFLALVVISLASSWGIGEVFNWGTHKDGSMKSRGKFYLLYIMESFPAMLIAIVLGSDLVNLVISLMVIFVIVLIPVGVLLGLLVSSPEVMGANRLSPAYMRIYWATFAVIEIAGILGILL